ncbi:hypothetical protein LJB56_15280 [Lachnospiraceae bacterium 210521-DFI.3.101]|nr:hypothetical protein [Lachnospiraceae bacterium 210521-DFI.3.101]
MERWLRIRDHPNYEVSNYGNVRNRRNGRLLKPVPNRKGGYYRVNLDGTQYYVHRLVVGAFFEESNKSGIKHTDGDHSNNALTNLEWEVN